MGVMFIMISLILFFMGGVNKYSGAVVIFALLIGLNLIWKLSKKEARRKKNKTDIVSARIVRREADRETVDFERGSEAARKRADWQNKMQKHWEDTEWGDKS